MSKFYTSITLYVTSLLIGYYYCYSQSIEIFVLVAFSLTLLYLLFLFAMSMFIRQNFYLKSISQNEIGKVVLTFDDGPHPDHTLKILDILDAYQIKAVFFMIGKNVEENPGIAKEVASRGHQVGIHSHSHSLNFGVLGSKKLKEELVVCANMIETATGIIPHLFRPPFGVTNPTIARQVNLQKLVSVGWSVRSFDTTTHSIEKIVKGVRKQMAENSIILLHDRLDQTVRALPHIIDSIRGKGFDIGELSISG